MFIFFGNNWCVWKDIVFRNHQTFDMYLPILSTNYEPKLVIWWPKTPPNPWDVFTKSIQISQIKTEFEIGVYKPWPATHDALREDEPTAVKKK